ncbi:Heterokaryon incompatibility protein 6, OR allele [Pseudocercospora fuligena]|uniref:Heterokaryon incompatibility protein 6, OR allele n=1 Tax=Pseudocercospora fuligena TaxID=685502 RepID=A0A8H6RKB9_9PEZI|nr:Heterokaryon incompatibility protein 6, OR allele [Pseudocercospora fuligena]
MAIKRQTSEALGLYDSYRTQKRPRNKTRPYQYESLPSGYIRILNLEPGCNDDQLRGTLISYSLESGLEYKAVSYAWGEPIFDQTIRLLGRDLPITTSLAGALRRFRDPKQSVRLWADAICINQSTIEEKNQQVAMMAQIYSEADEVLIWLGEAELTDAEFFWFLSRCSETHKRVEADRGWMYDRGVRDFGSLDPKPYYPVLPVQGAVLSCPCCSVPFILQSDSLDKAAKSFAAFWNKPWFKRLWVVQECALAKVAAMFCGPHRISMLRFIEAIQFLHYFYIMWPFGNPDNDLCRQKCYAQLSTLNFPASSCGNAASQLLYVVSSSQDRSTRDPRDRLHAIRGMCNEIEPLLPQPDYNMTPGKLWTDLSTLLLTRAEHWKDSKSFDMPHATFVIVLAGLQTISRHSLPSWVLDFGNLNQKATAVSHKVGLYHFGSFGGVAGGQYRDKGVSTFARPGELAVQVKMLGSLDSILPSSSMPSLDLLRSGDKDTWIEDVFMPWLQDCRKFLLVGNGPLETCQTRFVVEHLTHGRMKRSRAAEKFLDDTDCTAYESCSRHVELYNELMQSLSIKDIGSIFRYHKHLPDTLLASSSSGHFCWVPPKAAVGDRVCLIPGSPYIFLFRPVGDGKYEVVGDVWVQGALDGEAAPRDDDELEEIILV